MRAVEIQEPAGSPPVASTNICHCRLPILVTWDNLWTGWGETACRKCKKHYGWGMKWAKTHNYIPRKWS